MIHKRSQASRKGGGRGETASQISHRRRRGKKDGTAARYVMYPDPGTGRDELQKPPNPSHPINEVAPTPVTRRAFAGTLTPSPPLLPSSAPSVNGKRKPLRISKASAEDGAQRPLRHLLCPSPSPSPSSPHPLPKAPHLPRTRAPAPETPERGTQKWTATATISPGLYPSNSIGLPNLPRHQPQEKDVPIPMWCSQRAKCQARVVAVTKKEKQTIQQGRGCCCVSPMFRGFSSVKGDSREDVFYCKNLSLLTMGPARYLVVLDTKQVR